VRYIRGIPVSTWQLPDTDSMTAIWPAGTF